jgi:hypothetical protein
MLSGSGRDMHIHPLFCQGESTNVNVTVEELKSEMIADNQ